MAQVRKVQFWLDSAAGTLTEYTSELNQAAAPERNTEELDNTHINEDDKSIVAGIRSGRIPINGFFGDLSTSLYQVLEAAQGTTATKTFQVKQGSRYWNGECLPLDLKPTGDGKKLVMFSATLGVDGAVNRTTVALS